MNWLLTEAIFRTQCSVLLFIPECLPSKLSSPTAIPVFQPNFFPFIPSQEQKIVFPMSEGQRSTVILNDITELVFPCRFSGRPNPTVRFLRGSEPIDTTNAAYSVSEIRPGASVLIVDLSEVIGPIELICEGSTPAIESAVSGPAVTVDLIRE